MFRAAARNIPDSVIHREIRAEKIVIEENRTDRSSQSNSGTRTTRLRGELLEANRTASLGDLLAGHTSVAIKTLGQGALATSSFRGTSSSHTRVSWNGVPVNPAMRGNVDFSQFPVFFTDEVALYHGSSHLRNGSGALGGSIDLVNAPVWKEGISGSTFAEAGSFRSYGAGTDVRYGSDRSAWRTRIYRRQSENNYRYINKVYAKEDFKERREEARYRQTGVMQEAYFPVRGGTASARLWFHSGHRSLPQPLIVSNNRHERQRDDALRLQAGYDGRRDGTEYSFSGAYVLDLLGYKAWSDSDQTGTIHRNFNRSHAFHVKGSAVRTFSESLEAGLFLKHTYEFTDADAYLNRVDRNRTTLTASGRAAWKGLTVSAELMGERLDHRYAPNFSVGLAAVPLPATELKANAAYNRNYPSLNDLYWQPGGNPELGPEKGFTYDLTLVYTPKFGECLYFKGEVAAYLMNIDDWIVWLPSNYAWWQPQNVKKVRSYGVEASGEWTLLLPAGLRADLAINYTWSPSVNRERNFGEDDTYKKQLPYIPRKKANGRAKVSFGRFSFAYHIAYTGTRFTTADESYRTAPYTVHDLQADYRIPLRSRHSLGLRLRIDNLFDAYYESTRFYPMPLRSFNGSVTWNF